MKSEHRHELKTNELAEWIVNFPQWAKENAGTIIYLSIIAVVVGGLYFWKLYEKKVVSARKQLELTGLISQMAQSKTQILQAQAQGIDISYTLIQIADALQNAAQNAKDEQMAALALIKRAEALRMELHYRFGSVGRQDLEAQIGRAKNSYIKAAEKSSNPSLTATAKFGMGLCEEELGNFEQAQQIYSEIIANASFESTVAAAQAKQRLLTMADYQQSVIIKPSPKAPAELIRPRIGLKPPEGFQIPEESPGSSELNLPNQ